MFTLERKATIAYSFIHSFIHSNLQSTLCRECRIRGEASALGSLIAACPTWKRREEEKRVESETLEAVARWSVIGKVVSF